MYEGNPEGKIDFLNEEVVSTEQLVSHLLNSFVRDKLQEKCLV